jgi:hypothetical protein
MVGLLFFDGPRGFFLGIIIEIVAVVGGDS